MNDPKSKEIYEYCQQYSTSLPNLLYKLERETNLKTLAPQMLSGAIQGQFLQLFSKLVNPDRILEIGTFTGYATLCLAFGLGDNGIIDTIEINPELAYFHQKYFSQSEKYSQINSYIGDAKKIIPKQNHEYDLIFIDAGKMDNLFFYELCLEKLKIGGYILIDNVLWSGKILNKQISDKTTENIHSLNKHVSKDTQVINTLLPLRDGINIIQKIKERPI